MHDLEVEDLSVKVFDCFRKLKSDKIIGIDVRIIFESLDTDDWDIHRLMNLTKEASSKNSLIFIENFEFKDFKDEDGFGDLKKLLETLKYSSPLCVYIDGPDDKFRSEIDSSLLIGEKIDGER